MSGFATPPGNSFVLLLLALAELVPPPPISSPGVPKLPAGMGGLVVDVGLSSGLDRLACADIEPSLASV